MSVLEVLSLSQIKKIRKSFPVFNNYHRSGGEYPLVRIILFLQYTLQKPKKNVFSIGVYYGTSVFTLCFSISPSCALLLRNTCQVCMISVPHGSKVS